MQSDDFKWFTENMPKLYEHYGNCYLAIKDHAILGSYQSYGVAVTETEKQEPLGSFIVQKCGQDESAYTCYISSMNFM